MYQPLAPCSTCSRHVKTTETACPFCGSVLAESFGASQTTAAPRGVSRAAALALGASLAVTACGKTTTPATPDVTDAASSNGDNGTAVALYGAPPIDPPVPQVNDAAPVPARDGGPHDMGTMGTKYGGPPIRIKDAG